MVGVTRTGNDRLVAADLVSRARARGDGKSIEGPGYRVYAHPGGGLMAIAVSRLVTPALRPVAQQQRRMNARRLDGISLVSRSLAHRVSGLAATTVALGGNAHQRASDMGGGPRLMLAYIVGVFVFTRPSRRHRASSQRSTPNKARPSQEYADCRHRVGSHIG
jgi:hypothetical protein